MSRAGPGVGLGRVAAGEKERCRQQQDARDRETGPRAGDGREYAPQRGQRRDRGLGRDVPCGQAAGREVRRQLVEAVRGVHRVEQADAGDQAELDDHDQQQPAHARPDERQADGPARAQRAGDEHDPVPPEPRDEPGRQSRGDQTAGARDGERETELPRREPEPAEHEHGEQRLGRQDQAVHQDRVGEQPAQHRVAQDVPPAVEQVTRPQPRPARARRPRLVPADRADAQR